MKNNTSLKRQNILKLVQFSVLVALEALFCFTFLGSIPIGPVNATLMMVPVAICAVCMGPEFGFALGFLSGLFSFLVNSFIAPPTTAFMFTPVYPFPGTDRGSWFSLVICFIPRILAGFVPALIFGAFRNAYRRTHTHPSAPGSAAIYGLCGLTCSLVNTVGVLGLFWAYCEIMFRGNAELLSTLETKSVAVAVGVTALTNGLPEAILITVVAYAAGKPINRHMTHRDL